MSGFRVLAIVVVALPTVFTAGAQTMPVTLKSPNGALEISITTLRGRNPDAGGGQLAYSIVFRGQPVLEWSNLGRMLEGTPALGPAGRIETAQQSSHDETWKPVHGKSSPIRNQYNAVSVQTVETGQPARRLVVEARAYDDGRSEER